MSIRASNECCRHPESAPARHPSTRRRRNLLGLAVLVLGFWLLPVQAQQPLADIAQIAAGAHHTCALTTSGGVLCWGGQCPW